MSSPMNAVCPKSPTESEKNKRYDRQLRLWGDHGQLALEAAHICLINATATGTEVLKSIVLPGIGAFTIVDGRKVSGEDVGCNFFLDKSSIGKSRAQVATQLLVEMNADVRGEFVDESPEHLLKANPGFFDTYSLVIATGLHEQTLLALSERLWNICVPLIVCRSYGLIGYIRIQVSEHTVIESHPDNDFPDLRIDRPFRELNEFAGSFDFSSMSAKDHSHTPYPVILLQCLEEWKKQKGDIPKKYDEKKSFKAHILAKRKIKENDEHAYDEEENFNEAAAAVNTCLNPTCIPSNIKNLVNDPACLSINSESKSFWILMHALKHFIKTEGCEALPVRGTIPDMTADSEKYIQLQNVYRNKANEDASVVLKSVQQILSDLGKPQDTISEPDVKLFCKHAHALQVVRTRSIAEEYNSKTFKIQDITMYLDNPESEINFYVMLRAVDRFFATYDRYPGLLMHEVEPDVAKLKSCLSRIVQEWGCSPLAKDDYVFEMCRYGACELHSVAAFIGGCAAQEAIKLITGQYIPFNNTFIYNAMTATSATFEL